VPSDREAEIEAYANEIQADLDAAQTDSTIEEIIEDLFDKAVHVYQQFTEDEFYDLRGGSGEVVA
jgi:hypothetical protein